MASYRSAFWVNSFSLLAVIALIVYTQFLGSPAGILFEPPLAPADPNTGLLTHTFQLLCAVPPIVCTFSFGLLRTIQPKQTRNSFILYSALITGGFLVNEIFRIHIILLRAGIPKLITIVVYAIATLGYGLAFRQKIQSTPYILLLSGIGLLFSAIAVDSLKLSGDAVPVLLEGVPKLFSEINIALYFWFVCYGEILRSRNS
ncbi:hypothetical protein H6F78_20590 [Coleofasciculus sp. FACHB-64]|uniref:hypothetical protein n=1 Tax=Cyanophyceae TaxID=3028117 RepID=UPI0016878C2A|nr:MULTISPECIES: hypothetical protein [unclassified Coleofasciculus]MBD1836700.1 hypothetical protein [Coleofasciculus sp. FACHB-501]MBD2047960.1 hypothetical protein [Coleofasciculus sp. FACHB-64]